MHSDEVGKKILSLNFNQTNTLLAISSTKGFRIVRLDDCKALIKRDEENNHSFPGGFSQVVPVFSTPLICLIGSSANSRYPLNTVYFWDDHCSETRAEIRFRSEVKSVLIRKDRLIAVLEKATYVYMLNTLNPVSCIETVNNEKGVAAISYDKDIFVLLSLCSESGSIRMENFYTGSVKVAQMHENPIFIVAIDFMGNVGASASAQGTIIRVFDCNKLEVLYELRRGTSPALISCICFSPQLEFLLVSSNKSTVHIWKIEKKEKISGGMLSRYLPTYFQYNRSFGKLTLKPEIEWTCPFTVDIGPKACFITETEFFVATLDGNLHKCKINSSSGNVVVTETKPYFEIAASTIIERGRAWSSLE